MATEITTRDVELVGNFALEAMTLPCDSETLKDFNSRIQGAIVEAEVYKRESVAKALAEIKFGANQRFDQQRRAQG